MSIAEVLRRAERVRRSLTPEERERIRRGVEEARREIGSAIINLAKAIEETGDPDLVEKLLAKKVKEALNNGR